MDDLGRTRSGVPIVPALDGFRAYAILCVVGVHILALSGALAAMRGETWGLVAWAVLGNSIDAFFIVTGFVLFLPVVARDGRLGSVRSFMLGRAARLLPAYWLSLAVVLVLIAFVPIVPGVAAPSASSILIHLSVLHMPVQLFHGDLAMGFGLNGPVWMLSVIVGFYVVLVLIARTYFRHPLLGLVVAAALTVGWKLVILRFPEAFEAIGGASAAWVAQVVAVDQLPGWAFSFALGMTAAWAYVRFIDRPRAVIASRAVVVAAATLPIYLAFAYLYGRIAHLTSSAPSGGLARLEPFSTLGGSAARGVLMAAVALGPLWIARPFANGLTRWLAGVSYGLYLFHLIVGAYVGLWLGLPTDGSPSTVALWFVVVLPLSLLCAYLSSRFLEEPVRRWARSVERRPRRSEHPPADPVPAAKA